MNAEFSKLGAALAREINTVTSSAFGLPRSYKQVDNYTLLGSRAVVVHTVNPALGRQKQSDLCKFEASLVYRGSFRTGSNATEKPCL